MAEFFTPSTTGEGQGGAQILSADFTPLNASGIVRGIERASLSLAKQREQQYEEEKEKVKKEQELKNKISEARKGTGVATIDKAVNKLYEKGIKDAYSLDNDDPTGTMQQTIDDMNNLKDVAYPIFSKGLESSKSEIEKAGGASSFGEGGWKPTVVGRSYQQALDGTLYTEEEINRKIEGGTLLTDLVADFSVYKEDPDFHINSDVTSMASNLKKNLIDVYGAKKENLKNPSVIGGRDVVYKVSDFTPASKIKMKQEAQNNSQLKTAYRNQKMRKENLSLAEFEEKYPPEVFNAMFLEELINPMFEGATTEVISTKKDKEDGEGGLVEGEDYFIDEGADNPIDPLAYNEPRATEEDATLIAGDKIAYGDFKKLTPKGKYEIFTNEEGDKKIKAEVKEIKYKNGSYYLTVVTANPKKTGDVQTFSETEIEGTKEYLNQLKAKGLDVESILKPKEQKVLFYQLPDGTRKTPEEVEGILGEIPPDWEIVTEENIKQMDANRSEPAKEKEQGAVNEEETERPEPRKSTLTDAEVRAMYGKKVSKEVFKKMTVKQRAKFAQNAGTWEDE
jgi:hypothetical protein